MEYNFYNFNSTDFEHLVQSLTQNLLGNNSISYGSGPDGGRELTYIGKAPFPNRLVNWEGYWIIQAKFKARDFIKEDNYNWVEKNFREELRKFCNGVRKKPLNYLFITNAVLSPVNKKGGRDKMEAVKSEYTKDIPNICIISYDELCRLIDNNQSVRAAYYHLLTPGDFLTNHLHSVMLKKEEVNLAGNEIREKYIGIDQQHVLSISPILGIDFGTSYSAAAICTRNLEIVYVPSDKGKILVPSALTFFENGNYIVGKPEYLNLHTNQIQTITNVKRYLGTKKVFEIFGKKYSPEEISSFIVKSIKTNAEEFFGYEINNVVISKPANFTLKQTNSLVRVFQLAGLSILRILEEPSSASLVLNKRGDERFHYFVLDLGGGTLDISIIDASYGVYEIIAVLGDNELGGIDYDEAIFEYALVKYLDKFKTISGYERRLLFTECEKVKKELGHNTISTIHIDNIETSDGNLDNFSLIITRENFIKLTANLNSRVERLIDLALGKVTDISLEGVLLAGQGGRIFTVKSIISRKFGKLPVIDQFSENAVIRGVATFSGALSGVTKSNLILMNVFNYKLSIKCLGNIFLNSNNLICCDIGTVKGLNTQFLTILKENTRLPKHETFILNIVKENNLDEFLELEIFLADNYLATDKFVAICKIPLNNHLRLYLTITITVDATVLLIIGYRENNKDFYFQLNNLHLDEKVFKGNVVDLKRVQKLNLEFSSEFLQ